MCFVGLILSFSILFAASLAVYENNPEIRKWVDDSRRKIAVALHNFGDEIAPPQPSRNPNRPKDASTHEDNSPEAVERRRRAGQEIIERGRVLEERRRERRASTQASTQTFDDLVDEDGVLKSAATGARTTATEPKTDTTELKKRKIEVQGAAMGATLANPFADEIPMEFYPAAEPSTPIARTRSSTPTLPAASPREAGPSTPQTPNTLLVDTVEVSNHPSEYLVDLTPTSSSVPSSHHDDLASLSPISTFFQEEGDEAPPPAPWSVSINEWAENTTASFYSAPQSQPEPQDTPAKDGAATPTASESGEHVSQYGSDDMDFMSEMGISTPGSWTEVGSDSGDEF